LNFLLRSAKAPPQRAKAARWGPRCCALAFGSKELSFGFLLTPGFTSLLRNSDFCFRNCNRLYCVLHGDTICDSNFKFRNRLSRCGLQNMSALRASGLGALTGVLFPLKIIHGLLSNSGFAKPWGAQTTFQCRRPSVIHVTATMVLTLLPAASLGSMIQDSGSDSVRDAWPSVTLCLSAVTLQRRRLSGLVR
jgi:hypothetical protein